MSTFEQEMKIAMEKQLIYAARFGLLDVAKSALEYAQNHEEAAMVAAIHGHIAVCHMLFAYCRPRNRIQHYDRGRETQSA